MESFGRGIIALLQEGAGCIIAMDANSWLGKNYIKEDSHDQNNNGKLFQEFLERNPHLNILNTSENCTKKTLDHNM